MKQPLLTILVCTLPERRLKFQQLCHELRVQALKLGTFKDLEFLSDDTKRGEMTIGKKRNKLKAAATGKYICFLDDDDIPSTHYIKLMLEACSQGKDIITFDFNYFVDEQYLKTMIINRFLPDGNNHCSKHWSINYNPSHRFTVSDTYYHLCALKKELADKVTFIDANNAEDIGYSKDLIPLIKSEFHIEHTLLNVYYDTKKIQNV